MGLGLLGEQGGELIHCTIATLEKRMACIRKVERKMKTDGMSSSSSCSLPTPLRSKNKEKKDSAAVKLSLYFLFIVCTNTPLCIYSVYKNCVYSVLKDSVYKNCVYGVLKDSSFIRVSEKKTHIIFLFYIVELKYCTLFSHFVLF